MLLQDCTVKLGSNGMSTRVSVDSKLGSMDAMGRHQGSISIFTPKIKIFIIFYIFEKKNINIIFVFHSHRPGNIILSQYSYSLR